MAFQRMIWHCTFCVFMHKEVFGRHRYLVESNMIEIKNGSLKIGERQLFSRLSFIAADGKLTAVMGMSGSGKSALLSAMLGFLPLTEGYVSVNGEQLMPSTASFFRTQMSYVPQYCSCPGGQTVEDVFGHLMNCRPGRYEVPQKEQVIKNWEQLHIDASAWTAVLNCLPQPLIKRILLSFTACSRRQTLIIDEPTDGMEEAEAAGVMDFLREEANRGVAVLLTTKDEAVARMGDKRVII